MSISVVGLTKLYDTQKAIDAISFEVKTGEIVGFLGPNGAGKSTTMKILTGYLPPNSGSAKVCGFDVIKESRDVKRIIGYLPEHNPLYTEMFVKEYLGFIAGLYGLNDTAKRVKKMIEITGLTAEQHKRIGQLSKGYRQRVGLAAAMIHDPKVLILDEPTSGLDPNQILDIRSLITNMGADKTVILSSHIMQEVQAMCNRVVIINNGTIVADDKIEILKRMNPTKFVFQIEFDKSVSIPVIEKMATVERVLKINETTLSITASKDVRNDLFEFAVKNQLVIKALQEEKLSLEDVFHTLTKN
jgi:ABC-2 type transport system ATP-binding protein